MISRLLPAGYVLTGLLLAACDRDSAVSNERNIQLMSMAKEASGGAAWDRLAIMRDAGQLMSASGEGSRYEHWCDLHTLKTGVALAPATRSTTGVWPITVRTRPVTRPPRSLRLRHGEERISPAMDSSFRTVFRPLFIT
jgi:hypothetical protein